MAGRIITIAQQKGGSGKTTLTVNLAVELRRRGMRVAVLDTDPQGSLGRWFMERLERRGEDELIEFSTSSAWGAAYESDKLARRTDVVLIDTPPKIESDLRPALRAAHLVVVPVASSQVDLWATEGVLDMARRERRPVLVVLNRTRSGTRLAAEVAAGAGRLGVAVAEAQLAARVAYAETLGRGEGVADSAREPARSEIAALADEVMSHAQAAGAAT